MMYRFKQLIVVVLINITLSHGLYTSIDKCPGKDVKHIRQQVQHNEISLILYYTRWSADSLEALQQYNDVAVYYSDKIYFSSIDCWHLSCNCSRALNIPVGSGLPHKWPTLMAYYGRHGQLQIQYHGLWSFKDIQQFVHNLLYPLERFHADEDLQHIRLVSDAVVVGVFESPDSRQYKQYLMASLKWLESDPLRTYTFSVTFRTNDTTVAQSRLVKSVKKPEIVFMGAADIKRYTDLQGHIWNATNILIWLHKELKTDLKSLHGYSTPITIAQKLNLNSVIAIFVNDPHRFFTYMEYQIFPDKRYSTIASTCWKRIQQNEYKKALGVQHILEALKVYSDDKECYFDISAIMRNLGEYYEINNYLNFLHQNLAKPDSPSTTGVNEKPNITMLLRFHHITRCVNFDVGSSNHLQIGASKQLQIVVNNEAKNYGDNRTLSVVILDTKRYKDYLQTLGIIPKSESMADVFIIDMKQESILPMGGDFNMEIFRKFIGQYYQYNLAPHYKSEHSINAKDEKRNPVTSSNNYEVYNLNRFSFINAVQFSHNQTLILLIHSPECALCGTLQHTFLQIASALRSISSDLQFVRINALLNDLPWQFNMDSLPALIVFPKNRFGETRLFPSHLKPDFRNVFAFILKQLPAEDQIKTIVTYCQSPAIASSYMQSCWRFAKNLLMQHISSHLHYWQLFENERSLIFQHLRAFKDMSLDVQRNLRL
ncbi:thioredoxin domain-containing protein 11 [Haematobia irritans]|uniref:thioredoxin domain-containing protein 11 n=1 Tax=Haematobia irritans TaxID=7368 RepID=UPI003F5086D5